MFGKHLFNEAEYIKYVQKDRAHRSFLTHVYDRNLPLVRENINRKKH